MIGWLALHQKTASWLVWVGSGAPRLSSMPKCYIIWVLVDMILLRNHAWFMSVWYGHFHAWSYPETRMMHIVMQSIWLSGGTCTFIRFVELWSSPKIPRGNNPDCIAGHRWMDGKFLGQIFSNISAISRKPVVNDHDRPNHGVSLTTGLEHIWFINLQIPLSIFSITLPLPTSCTSCLDQNLCWKPRFVSEFNCCRISCPGHAIVLHQNPPIDNCCWWPL